MSHIYELYSRDRTHPVRVYLLHEDLFTEEEFFDLILSRLTDQVRMSGISRFLRSSDILFQKKDFVRPVV